MNQIKTIDFIYNAANEKEREEINNFFANKLYANFYNWLNSVLVNIQELAEIENPTPEIKENLDELKQAKQDAWEMMKILSKNFTISQTE